MRKKKAPSARPVSGIRAEHVEQVVGSRKIVCTRCEESLDPAPGSRPPLTEVRAMMEYIAAYNGAVSEFLDRHEECQGGGK